MEIKFEDYLSNDEIHRIVVEEFRDKIKESIRRNGVSRFIANLSYQNVFELINDEAPNFENEIKEKTKEVIENLSSFSVFRKKDLVDNEDSLAQKYLEESVTNNREIIENRVKDILSELSKEDIAYEINDVIENKISNLFNKGDNND